MKMLERCKRVCKNRINALPNDLLVTILMFIPIQEAVSTMILSKRWRFVWTIMPKLEYEESNDECKKSIWWFLDKSLQLHKAPLLTTLHMKLGPLCPRDANVGKWVSKAVDCGLRKLELELLSSTDRISLPNTLYSCKSLKMLILSHNILIDVPSSAYLPSLTVLILNSVVYKTEDSIVRILSSCPIVKSLTVKREKNDNVKKFIVKAPYLLDFMYINFWSINDMEDTNGRCLVIDTPMLTYLRVTDYSRDSWLIKNKPCFVEQAYINLDWFLPDLGKFLRYFSEVLFLELDLTKEMFVCCSLIKFTRLIECKIIPNDIDWIDSLVPFLQNTPKLKFLIVDYEFTDHPPIASYSWRESSYDPECLSLSLEKFEVISYGGREEEQELVEYILMNSKCLKTATMSFRSTLEVIDRMTMMEKLKAIPKKSVTSKLFFK